MRAAHLSRRQLYACGPGRSLRRRAGFGGGARGLPISDADRRGLSRLPATGHFLGAARRARSAATARGWRTCARPDLCGRRALDARRGHRRERLVAEGPITSFAIDADARAGRVRAGWPALPGRPARRLDRTGRNGPKRRGPAPIRPRRGPHRYVSAGSLDVVGPSGDALLAGESGAPGSRRLSVGVPDRPASSAGTRGWWWSPDGRQILATRAAGATSLHLLDLWRRLGRRALGPGDLSAPGRGALGGGRRSADHGAPPAASSTAWCSRSTREPARPRCTRSWPTPAGWNRSRARRGTCPTAASWSAASWPTTASTPAASSPTAAC